MNEKHYDRKNHPIWIAALAVTGTITVYTLLLTQVILPTYNAGLLNKINIYEEQIVSLNSTLKDLRNQVEGCNKQNNSLNESLSEVQLANLFQIGNPYPVGFDSIRIGDHIDKIYQKFDKEKHVETIDQKGFNSLIRITGQHIIFNEVRYYYSSNKLIKFIIFEISDKEKHKKTLIRRLTSMFGEPKSWHGEFFSWKTKDDISIYMDNLSEIHIMRSIYMPDNWPSE